MSFFVSILSLLYANLMQFTAKIRPGFSKVMKARLLLNTDLWFSSSANQFSGLSSKFSPEACWHFHKATHVRIIWVFWIPLSELLIIGHPLGCPKVSQKVCLWASQKLFDIPCPINIKAVKMLKSPRHHKVWDNIKFPVEKNTSPNMWYNGSFSWFGSYVMEIEKNWSKSHLETFRGFFH